MSTEIDIGEKLVKVKKVTGDEEPSTYGVWFEKTALFMEKPPKSLKSRDRRFAKVAEVTTDGSLENVYNAMQGHIWNENLEGNDLVERIDVDHVSMSVGDLIHDKENNKWYVTARMGFSEFEMDESKETII